jgi:hypothetical protein
MPLLRPGSSRHSSTTGAGTPRTTALRRDCVFLQRLLTFPGITYIVRVLSLRRIFPVTDSKQQPGTDVGPDSTIHFF